MGPSGTARGLLVRSRDGRHASAEEGRKGGREEVVEMMWCPSLPPSISPSLPPCLPVYLAVALAASWA